MDGASSEFWDAFTTAGSMVTECVCGRTHFSTQDDAGSWEDGELYGLLAKAEANPGRYIATSDDSVSVGFMDGVPVCYGCPCGTAAKYEKFLIVNEASILDYFRRIAKRKRLEMERTEAALQLVIEKGGKA